MMIVSGGCSATSHVSLLRLLLEGHAILLQKGTGPVQIVHQIAHMAETSQLAFFLIVAIVIPSRNVIQ